MTFFEAVKPLPVDPVFGIAALYQDDVRKDKVDLTLGVYHDENLKATILRAVKEAESELVDKETTKTYLPILGKSAFLEESKKLLFGEDFIQEHHGRIFAAQTAGGTGALRIGGEFLAKNISKKVFLSDPTWLNHHGIFGACGMEKEVYPYYNRQKGLFDCDRFLAFLDQLEPKSIVVLHTCCHNPSGCDPTKDEWKAIEQKIAQRKLIPFFDTAYLGFAQTLEEDSWPIRYFARRNHVVFVAFSCSKSFGLYAERTGALFILTHTEKERATIGSVIKRLIRTNYSNPPVHGAAIVALILSHPALRALWQEELVAMRHRIEAMRSAFFDALMSRSRSEAFEHLRSNVGMFALLPLTEDQVGQLMKERGIYMMKSGRINLTGLNHTNLSHVVEAIAEISEKG